MGYFSWYTQDTKHRILIDEPFRVIMSDDKGNKYTEECYEGFGMFGGKDYYVLLAEMNGYSAADFGGNEDKLRSKGIELAFSDSPDVLFPSLTESGKYMGGAPPETDPNQGFRVKYCDSAEDLVLDELEEEDY